MEDLISFLVFILFIGGSIVNSISQAKKKRKAELEEALAQPPEDLKNAGPPIEREALPPRPAPKPVSKTQGWDELRRQLERMLGEPDLVGREIVDEEPEVPPPVPQTSQPRPVAFGKARPAPALKQSKTKLEAPPRGVRKGAMSAPPTRKKSRGITLPWTERSKPKQVPKQIPTHTIPPKGVSSKPEPALAATVRPPAPEISRNPFDFHPNPIVNAVLVSEILGQRKRNPIILPRPTLPSR